MAGLLVTSCISSSPDERITELRTLLAVLLQHLIASFALLRYSGTLKMATIAPATTKKDETARNRTTERSWSQTESSSAVKRNMAK